MEYATGDSLNHKFAEEGDYIAKYYPNDTYKDLAKCEFSIKIREKDKTILTAEVNDKEVTIKWINAPKGATDFIGIYHKEGPESILAVQEEDIQPVPDEENQHDNSLITFQYVKEDSLIHKQTVAGNYIAKYHPNNNAISVLAECEFEIKLSEKDQVTMAAQVTGNTVTISWKNSHQGKSDWIGTYDKRNPKKYLTFEYVRGDSLTYTQSEGEGQYIAKYHPNNEQSVIADCEFQILDPQAVNHEHIMLLTQELAKHQKELDEKVKIENQLKGDLPQKRKHIESIANELKRKKEILDQDKKHKEELRQQDPEQYELIDKKDQLKTENKSLKLSLSERANKVRLQRKAEKVIDSLMENSSKVELS